MDERFISERITELRLKKGVSARDMSLSLGQNAGYINNIESGKALPSLTVLLYICDYFRISPKEFFDTENSDPHRTDIICAKLGKLSTRQLKLIEELADELLNR